MKQKLTALLLVVIMATSFLACAGEDVSITIKPVEEALSDSVFLLDGQTNGVGFLTGTHRFDLYRTENGYALRSVNCASLSKKDALPENSAVSYRAEEPISLSVRLKGDTEETYTACYEQIGAGNHGVLAIGTVETKNGSRFSVQDEYTIVGDVLNCARTVTVEKASASDLGFSSRLSMRSAIDGESGSYDDLEYFIPGIWYKDTSLNSSGGIASATRTRSIFVKETRTGLPLIMGRIKETGETLSVCHFDPQISSDTNDVLSSAVLTNGNYRCGSLGVTRDPSPTLSFVYPTVEQPVVYQSSYPAVRRYHPVEESFVSSYCVSLRASQTDDYWTAMEETYRRHYALQEKEIYDVDLQAAYEACMKTMNAYCYSANTTYGTITGIPYGAFVSDGHVESGLTMEMGFVGMELSIAYQMMRYGDRYGDETSTANGLAIADLWAEQAATDNGVVKVYMLSDGSFYPMPCYLRRMTDGMEGLLSCYRYQANKEVEKDAWLEMIVGYADFLVKAQNEDGSWYRAYDYGGRLFTPENGYGQVADIENVMADSKNSTPIPVRFLVRMYELTGKEAYLTAAEKGAQYTIDTLFAAGKFGGATCDGHDRTDRETGCFVLYGMNALYAVTGNENYLQYAEYAAAYVASWTVLYSYKIADAQGIVAGENFVREALTDGLSIISTGHSGVDNFMSYVYCEFFKLYVWTEDDFYSDFALFAQNNTKKTLNLNNKMGFAQDGFCLEGTYLSEFGFLTAGTTGVWLPWSGNAVVEPIAEATDIFGKADVSELKEYERSVLLEKLASYGAGGKRSK